MEHIINQAILRGKLISIPEFSHENHGKRFYRFYLEVPRLSGNVDLLPVIVPQEILDPMKLRLGDTLGITGQVRSHNLRSQGRRKLMIFVFASEIEPKEGEAVNEILLEGPICREPVFRRTPLGREICDVMLAVPRVFHRADYLPCILWGRIAQEASACHTRDVIRIQGRLQSRQYTKLTDEGMQQRTAYEVSALSAEFFRNEATSVYHDGVE